MRVEPQSKKRGRDNRSRTRTKQERFDEIVEAAAAVIARHGYRRSSIQQIADELGITPAALYHYVASKEDLLVEICMRAGHLLLAEANEVAALNAPPEEKVRLVAVRHLQLLKANRQIFTILIAERSELPEASLKQIVEGERSQFAVVLRIILELEDLRVDARIATYALFGMLNWTLRWYSESGIYNIEGVATEYSRILLRGVCGGGDIPLATMGGGRPADGTIW